MLDVLLYTVLENRAAGALRVLRVHVRGQGFSFELRAEVPAVAREEEAHGLLVGFIKERLVKDGRLPLESEKPFQVLRPGATIDARFRRVVKEAVDS